MESDQSAREEPAFLPERLLESCEDDVDLAREVVEDFLESAPRGLSRLADAVAAGDPARAGLEAHSLKGISRTIGAEALAAAAARLEASARGGDLSDAPALLADAEGRLAALRALLSTFPDG